MHSLMLLLIQSLEWSDLFIGKSRIVIIDYIIEMMYEISEYLSHMSFTTNNVSIYITDIDNNSLTNLINN